MVCTVQKLLAVIVTWLRQMNIKLLQTSTDPMKTVTTTGRYIMQTQYKQMTKNFEGLRLKPYKCTAGKLTIGYGRNLEDVGISQAEADMLFERDFAKAEADARKICKDFNIDVDNLIEQRFYVLVDMSFNLGYAGLSKFKNMLTAVSKGDYQTAAREMLESLWAIQVGNRATKLSLLMEG